jgi:hypothetical protein
MAPLYQVPARRFPARRVGALTSQCDARIVWMFQRAKRQAMSNEVGKRQATLGAPLELKEAVAQGDLKTAQDCRDKRLILAVDLFSGDRRRLLVASQMLRVSS